MYLVKVLRRREYLCRRNVKRRWQRIKRQSLANIWLCRGEASSDQRSSSGSWVAPDRFRQVFQKAHPIGSQATLPSLELKSQVVNRLLFMAPSKSSAIRPPGNRQTTSAGYIMLPQSPDTDARHHIRTAQHHQNLHHGQRRECGGTGLWTA